MVYAQMRIRQGKWKIISGLKMHAEHLIKPRKPEPA